MYAGYRRCEKYKMAVRRNTNTDVFFNLLRAGLWEQDVQLASYEKIDFNEVYRLAEEQSVVGLVSAGIEHIVDVKVPQEVALTFVGSALQLEQRNKAMNQFVGALIEKLRTADIYTLLVKGQGIAQCYERPLWRVSGDVDLYLSKNNYNKAKAFLSPLAEHVDKEDKHKLHLGMTINSWIVELHGTMYTEISNRMNAVSDEVNTDIFLNGNVRSWDNGGVQISLPNPDNDVIIIFNHYINHFYGEGIGLRQICDWCRLLWYYKSKINSNLLERRIRKAGLMTEWKAFAAFAADYLGMAVDAIPFYDNRNKYRNKADKIAELIIETGSFGSKKDYSYRQKGPQWKVYVQTFITRMSEFIRLTTVFPLNAPKFFVTYTFNRVKAVL